MESLKNIQTLTGHSEPVWYVSWNPQGSLLASCSADKTVKIWEYSSSSESWICVYTISNQHKRIVRRVAWSPCGKLLASAGFDSVVCVWRIDISKPVTVDLLTDLDSHSYEVKAVSFSVSGRFLATCSRDKTVQIWEIDDDDDFTCSSMLQSHLEDVKCLCWHPTDDILVSGSYDNTIKIYKENYDDWEVVASLKGHSSTVWQVTFNCSGDILASCSDDCTVRLWIRMDSEFSKWVNATILSGYHQGVIYDISWSSLNILASVSEDNSVCVYRIGQPNSVINGDASGGIEVELLTRANRAHDEDLNCCSWRLGAASAGQTMLATGSDDGLIKLWTFSDPDLPID